MKDDPHPFLSAYALAEATVRGVLRSKIVWLALAASGIHVAVRVGIIAFVSLFLPAEVAGLFDDVFLSSAILMQVTIPLVVVGGVVGSNITARDRMMGGLEFLLSKALPPWGYVVGRILAPLTAALLLVFVPIVVFDLLMLVLVDPLPTGAGEVMWGALGVSLVFCLALGPLAAGLGTLVDNPRKATGIWLGVVWLTSPLVPIALEMGVDWYWAFNPVITIQVAAGQMMGFAFPTATGEWFAWLLVAFYIVAPFAILYWRTREVVN